MKIKLLQETHGLIVVVGLVLTDVCILASFLKFESGNSLLETETRIAEKWQPVSLPSWQQINHNILRTLSLH